MAGLLLAILLAFSLAGTSGPDFASLPQAWPVGAESSGMSLDPEVVAAIGVEPTCPHDVPGLRHQPFSRLRSGRRLPLKSAHLRDRRSAVRLLI